MYAGISMLADDFIRGEPIFFFLDSCTDTCSTTIHAFSITIESVLGEGGVVVFLLFERMHMHAKRKCEKEKQSKAFCSGWAG